MNLEFGKVVKKFRLRKDYDLDYCVNRIGFKTKSSWSDLESARGNNPKLDRIFEILKALGAGLIISPNAEEPLRIYDDFNEPKIPTSIYSEELLKFIKDPNSKPYLVAAQILKECGKDSLAFNSYMEILERYDK